MNYNRILSLVKRDLQSFRNSKWKWLEVFYFPITSIIIWGLFALWGTELGTDVGKIAVIINIFWSYVYIVQSTADILINEDMWSHAGRNVFATGVTTWEYVLAHCFFSVLVSLPALIFIFGFAYWLFRLDFMLLFPLATLHLMAITMVVGITWAIIIAALLFLTGRELNFISWSLFQLFIMLSFPLFPTELLPKFFHFLAKIMPLTEIFSAVRALAQGNSFSLYNAWIITAVYFLLAIFFYQFAVNYSRKSGKMVKSF